MPEAVEAYGRDGAGLGSVDGRLGQQTLDLAGMAAECDGIAMERVGEDGRYLGRGGVVRRLEGLGNASGVEGVVHRLSMVSDARYWTNVNDRAEVILNLPWQPRGVGVRVAWMHHAAVVLVAAAAAAAAAAEQRQSALWERRERRCPEPLDSLQAMVDRVDVCALLWTVSVCCSVRVLAQGDLVLSHLGVKALVCATRLSLSCLCALAVGCLLPAATVCHALAPSSRRVLWVASRIQSGLLVGLGMPATVLSRLDSPAWVERRHSGHMPFCHNLVAPGMNLLLALFTIKIWKRQIPTSLSFFDFQERQGRMISDDKPSVIPQQRRPRFPRQLQHRQCEVSHQLPMVSKLTITRPKLGRPILSQTTKTTLRCRIIPYPHETSSRLVVSISPSLLQHSLTFRHPETVPTMIVSGLPRSVLAERLACEPHLLPWCLPCH